MANVNYKSAFHVLKNRYPSIADEIVPEPELTDFSKIPGIIQKFSKQTGYQLSEIKKNKNESLILLIALIVRAYDPGCFVDYNKKMINGLRAELTKNLECEKTWISHLFKIVRTYTRINKGFRTDLDYLYAKVIRPGYATNRDKS